MYPSKETFLKSGVWKAVQALGGIAVAFLLLAALIYVVTPEVAGITVGVILSVVSALALAIVALVAIFFAIYLYESRLKMTYDARLRRLIKSLEYPASPLEIGIVIVLSVFGLAVVLLWPAIPFPAGFSPIRLVPLFSPAFGTFVPYYVLWLVATIAAQVLYLVLRQKWVPSLVETGLSLASALLIFWVLPGVPVQPGAVGDDPGRHQGTAGPGHPGDADRRRPKALADCPVFHLRGSPEYPGRVGGASRSP